MGTTKKQKRMFQVAGLCDRIAGNSRSEVADKIRADQRKVEKRKRRQFRGKP